MTRSWWRRERRAIALLPLGLLLALGGTASRIDEYWWNRGFHEPAEVVGGWTQVDDRYDDGYLAYPIRAEVRLASAERVDEVAGASEPVAIATGGELWRVELDWQADPDVMLRGCRLALVGDDDVLYQAGTEGWDATSEGLRDKCLPEDRYGPQQQVGSTAQPRVPDGEQSRPRTWRSTAYVVTKEGFEPDAVRLWWYLPRYAELPIG